MNLNTSTLFRILDATRNLICTLFETIENIK